MALAATIVAGSALADQRVIVLLQPSQGARSQAATIDRNAPRIYAKWRVVPGFAATVDDAEMQRLRNDPAVTSVEPDLGGSVTAVSSEGSIGLNGELIGLPAVHALGYDGTGSTVAVLGTGVSPHPDLNGRIVEERCYCAYANGQGCCPNGATQQFGTGSARDDLGHETNVAGVIAGRGGIAPIGIAPGAKIVAIRTNDATGNIAWTSQVISALDSILASPVHVDAVNMSFAIGFLSNNACDGDNPALTDAMARVRARGIVLVAATRRRRESVRPPASRGFFPSARSTTRISRRLRCWDAPTRPRRSIVSRASRTPLRSSISSRPVTAFSRRRRMVESRTPAERRSQRRMWPGPLPCCGRSIHS